MIPFFGNAGGPNSHTWKGGRTQDRTGAIHVWIGEPTPEHPNVVKGYMLEHRYIFENYHKCCLIPGLSVIRHKNKVNWDNRIENLYPQIRNVMCSIENKGKVLSDDTRKKISKHVIKQQQTWDEETKQERIRKAVETRKAKNLPSPLRGRKHKPETIEKFKAIRNTETGRKAGTALWKKHSSTPEERQRFVDYLAAKRKNKMPNGTMFGKHHSEEVKRKIGVKIREYRMRMKSQNDPQM